jgi:hypothetical protein
MKDQPTKEDLLAEAENLRFETRESSVLDDAMSDYEAQQSVLAQADFGESEEAWGVLANQVVGHETF